MITRMLMMGMMGMRVLSLGLLLPPSDTHRSSSSGWIPGKPGLGEWAHIACCNPSVHLRSGPPGIGESDLYQQFVAGGEELHLDQS